MADGKNRKCGNNKDACKLYSSAGRLERNKRRNKRRAEWQAKKAAAKISRRIAMKKPVHSRHLPHVHNGIWRWFTDRAPNPDGTYSSVRRWDRVYT